MPSVPVGNIHLHYDRAGSGAPVVFVHGGFATLARTLPGAEWSWGDWENALAGRFNFITYDRRGCGRSWCPETGFDLVNQADDLASLLDQLSVPSAHLIGSSAGGPISIVFAAIYPQRVRSLTLAGTGLELFPQGDGVSDTIREQIATLEVQGSEAAFDSRPAGVEAWLETLWRREEAEANGTLGVFLESERLLSAKAQKIPRDVRVHYYAAELHNINAYIDADVAGFARRVIGPVLVLHGDADRIVPASSSEQLAGAIASAELLLIPKVGHGVLWGSPDALERVAGFIEAAEARFSR